MKFYRKARGYWSLSRFAKRLNTLAGIENPQFLTMGGWEEHHKASKEKAPFTYWLTRSFLNKLQDFLFYPSNLIYSVKVYIKNVKGNTHVLDGGLNKGQWYDLTYRIPRCLFTELENYIENEKGLETLAWEKTLMLDEDWGVDKDNPSYGKPSHQALAAIEQEEIYLWWKSVKGEDVAFDQEEAYQEKETEMLIRLIKIRGSLWT